MKKIRLFTLLGILLLISGVMTLRSEVTPNQPSPLAPRTLPHPSEAPKPDCPCTDPQVSVMFKHPHYCNYYFECTNRIPRLMKCPDGLVFDERTSNFVFPEESNHTHHICTIYW